MDPLDALSNAPPKQARNAATAADAAAWLDNPTEQETQSRTARYISQLESEPTIDLSAPLCRNCGNITQPSGTCHTCPCCGESDGCA